MRRAKEGTSAVLLQSGLDEKWWADSMECSCYRRNIQDLLSDWKTHYEKRRFGVPFNGLVIPFGAMVEYHSASAKDQSRIHQFGKKVLHGLFLGYALYAGKIWKGDVLVADLEELETMDASEIYSKRLNAKEVTFPEEKGEFIFPIADGRIKLLGGDQDLRTSISIRHRPIRGESHVDFLGESGGSLPPPHDSFPDAGEAINHFWSMSGNLIYRHHVEPTVKLCSPREESFPVPLKYIDVSRTTHTNLDVKQEKRIDDYWNIDGSRHLILEEKPPNGFIYVWSGERLTKRQATSQAYNPFNTTTKKMIQDVGNVELFELFETDPKTQCKECLSYWSEGIVYCTCGHLLKEIVANIGVIEYTMDFLSIPEYIIKKGRPHGHRYGKTPENKEYHLVHNLKKRCIKRKFTGIHDRFLRDPDFRLSVLEHDRDEDVCLKWDELAEQEFTYRMVLTSTKRCLH